MTREEAIHFAECLKNNWTIDFNDMEDFCNMAIRSLEAWDKVIYKLQISSTDDLRYGRYDDLSNVVISVMNIINDYLEEVEDDN